MDPFNDEYFMKQALVEACSAAEEGEVPVGAVIVCNNQIIARAHNQTERLNDPTAHAEIGAIRAACAKLGTYDLSGYSIYASGYPCPMCMSAILWSRIDTLFYSATYADAEKIGFRDDFIRAVLGGNENPIPPELLKIERIQSDRLEEIYESYAKTGEIY